MIDELGIEPSEQLQWLERAILNSDPVLKPSHATWRRPAASQVPNLVPADIADFTGRTGQIESIRRHLIGKMCIRDRARIVPEEDAWVYSPAWQEKLQEAEADLAAGRVRRFEDVYKRQRSGSAESGRGSDRKSVV